MTVVHEEFSEKSKMVHTPVFIILIGTGKKKFKKINFSLTVKKSFKKKLFFVLTKGLFILKILIFEVDRIKPLFKIIAYYVSADSGLSFGPISSRVNLT